ncbi:hypothetical protein BC828DRAFT_384006 [Blastocladiella britannica]|nr:hypothetical protein BC828DRAFT_384006 [Blastocladiella britannica]
MIIDVASRFLDFAVALASNASEIADLLHVLSRAETPHLTQYALARALPEFGPCLAAKHGHAQLLLPLYPRGLVVDNFLPVLHWTTLHNDIPMLRWCWTHFGNATIARNTWISRELGTAVGSAGHLSVLEWFMAQVLVPQKQTNMLMHIQAAASLNGHRHAIEWCVSHCPEHMHWDWIGPSAAERGHRPILALWWRALCQDLNEDERRPHWVRIMNILVQHGHIDAMDWLWAEGSRPQHIELSYMLRLYGKRTPTFTTQVHVLDWILAHFVAHDDYVCQQFGTQFATYLLQQGRSDLVEWVVAHLASRPMFAGAPAMKNWSSLLALHEGTTVEYISWWWETGIVHNWPTTWVRQIPYIAGIASRDDLLNWAWANSPDFAKELNFQHLVSYALKYGHESILEWVWARRELAYGTTSGRPRLSTLDIVYLARHNQLNILKWWHTHWCLHHRDWMHILREATRYDHLCTLLWWQEHVLAERPKTSTYYLRHLEFFLETSASVPIIAFWGQFAAAHGHDPIFCQCRRALVTASNLSSIANLDWWAALLPFDLILRTAPLAFKHALERNRRPVIEWWIEFHVSAGVPIRVPHKTSLQLGWQWFSAAAQERGLDYEWAYTNIY